MPEHVQDPSWYMDMDASNHVTAELGNLTLSIDYTGKERIIVGNGFRLIISHVGIGFYKTNDKNLILKGLLHVPQIKKNLVSNILWQLNFMVLFVL